MTSLYRRICLIGVRGVGKSTLAKKIISELPHIDYIVGSSVLRTLAGDDFEHFDALPESVKHNYRVRAIEWMEQRQHLQGKTILCDGHTSLYNEKTSKVERVFTESDCRFFNELILLEAPLNVVLERRLGNPEKKRHLDPQIIQAEIKGEREISTRIAAQWNMKTHQLSFNNDEIIIQNVKDILQ